MGEERGGGVPLETEKHHGCEDVILELLREILEDNHRGLGECSEGLLFTCFYQN